MASRDGHGPSVARHGKRRSDSAVFTDEQRGATRQPPEPPRGGIRGNLGRGKGARGRQ